MGILDRLLGRKPSSTTPAPAPTAKAASSTTPVPPEAPRRDSRPRQTFPVVGESHYQGALLSIAGGYSPESMDRPCRARLVPEPTNAQDPNAVIVQVAGRTVGYLSAASAAKYGAITEQLREPLECDAIIVGGWRKSRDDIGSFGVRLLLPSITLLRGQIIDGRWTGDTRP